MKRFIGSIKQRGGSNHLKGGKAGVNGDTPEASATRGVRLFCESGGPNNSGEEVLHLPVIVDAAESSPSAAREAANEIRKFLGKDSFQRAYVQYNAIMLVRILADNPGKTFTRNLDTKFVITMKELLRDGKDMSVQQLLRETLDTLEVEKANDEGLAPLVEMWKREKAKLGRHNKAPGPRTMVAPPYNPNQQYNPPREENYFARNHKVRGLPQPHELAQRIEEARTSGKLLLQVVQSTPPNEVLGNELIKEFAERCQSASSSIQSYIHSDNPAPDDDTLLTLIETNDQLTTAMSRHQRALLQARRNLGAATPNPSLIPPPGPPPGREEFPFNRHAKADVPISDTHSYGPPPSLPQETSYISQNGHLGYQPTPSDLDRQESSLNNATMRGVPIASNVAPEPPRQPIQYRF